MPRYAAFLRGVNVGGINLKMADVVTALTAAGFTDVSTVLASGNVLLSSAGDAAQVRTEAESVLRKTFGYEAWVLVYTLDTVAAIDAGYPFEREIDGYHSYVTFVSDPEVLGELATLEAGADERIDRGPGVLYWQVPRASTLDSTIGKTMGKARFKSSTTTRNLRTLGKVLARG